MVGYLPAAAAAAATGWMGDDVRVRSSDECTNVREGVITSILK